MDPALRLDLGAILTGGAAKRMGGRKADLEVAGRTLTEHVHLRIKDSCVKVVCVGGDRALAPEGIELIPDLFPGADSLGGIATALKYALDEMGPEAWVLCVGCDMPLISPRVIELIASRRRGRDVVATHTGPGYEPLCSIYRAGIYPLLEERILAGLLRVRDVFALADTVVVGRDELQEADPGLAGFCNVNSPADLAKVSRALMERA